MELSFFSFPGIAEFVEGYKGHWMATGESDQSPGFGCR